MERRGQAGVAGPADGRGLSEEGVRAWRRGPGRGRGLSEGGRQEGPVEGRGLAKGGAFRRQPVGGGGS